MDHYLELHKSINFPNNTLIKNGFLDFVYPNLKFDYLQKLELYFCLNLQSIYLHCCHFDELMVKIKKKNNN